MRRRVLLAVGCCLLLGLGACGPDADDVPPPEVLKGEGDAFMDRGLWARAAERYRLAFAVEDPLPERAKQRAWLAYRRGLALSRIPLPEEARRWFERALRLDASHYPIHFQLGMLHDGRHPETTDPPRARAAYERFLAASEAAGSPEADRPLVEEARRRLEEPAAD